MPDYARQLSVVVGLFLMAFAVVALSGPGRIDVVDGQTRYEVSRSLVEHGDCDVRNPNVWFSVFPGRSGRLYTYYRFPQSVLGVGAVLLSDATGPVREERRHFFFALTSAAAAAALAVLYLLWFRRQGLSEVRAVFWASAGILCTPNWFYGTSTFDDILGTAAVVASLVVATSRRWPSAPLRSLCSGLLVGLAFACKQPLVVFGLAALAASDDPDEPRGRRVVGAVCLGMGVLAGIGLNVCYDAYKFPPGTLASHVALLQRYVPVWPGHPLTALLALAVSPAAGVLWYCPPLLLCLHGFRNWSAGERPFLIALLVGFAAFVGFVASMSIFKGDPSWGPRYLTPLFAVMWLFSSRGSACWRRADTATVLTLGLFVQVAALSVDPHRLYVERKLPSVFGAVAPILYFDPKNAHIIQRPREIREAWNGRHQASKRFSPSPQPTFAFPVIDEVKGGPAAIFEYKLLNSFRPWWISFRYLPPEERPVSISGAAAALVGTGLVGLLMTAYGVRRRTAPPMMFGIVRRVTAKVATDQKRG